MTERQTIGNPFRNFCMTKFHQFNELKREGGEQRLNIDDRQTDNKRTG